MNMYESFSIFKLCWCKPLDSVNDHLSYPVSLDSHHMGNGTIIIKNGQRICGSGGALCNLPIVQDKAYFEIKVQQSGVWGFGLATRQVNLNAVPMGTEDTCWVFRQDGTIYHSNKMFYKSTIKPEECDILGISYNHDEMAFYKNGKLIEGANVTGLKGTLYPLFYVDEGAILDIHFTNFVFPPPTGYSKIMMEHTLI